jgi:hypothetical protein
MYFVFSLFSPLCTDSRFFDWDCFAVSQKKDRAAFAGGPSQGGNARGRAAIEMTYRVRLFLQIKSPGALTGLNFRRASKNIFPYPP